MTDRLIQLWYRPRQWAYLLAPLGLLFRCASAVRRTLYRRGLLRSNRLGVPVIVVGNITVGGTGKTPLTQWLVEALQGKGRQPGVVSRSYAASARTPQRVTVGSDPTLHGDEAVLLANRLSCPVWSGPDRVDTARALLAGHPDVDVLVCDDGLQHYALARDVEIVVIDAMRGLGNGLSLPAGPLREPPSRLRTVDAIVVNGTSDTFQRPAGVPCFGMALRGDRFRNVADPTRSAMAGEFSGQRIAAIAGIGNPARFFAQLHGQGLEFESHVFPDHHRYRAHDLRRIDAEIILMTEKDAIKCACFADARMWVLPVTAALNEGLLELVLERIGAGSSRNRRGGTET